MGIAIILGIVLFAATAGLVAVCVLEVRKQQRLTLSRAPKDRGTKGIINSKIILCAVAAAAVFLVFVFVPFGFVQVDAGEMAVVKTFGEVKGTKTAGLYWRNLATTSYEKYDIKTQQIVINNPVYTADAQVCDTQLLVQYKITPSKLKNIAIEYGSMDLHLDRLVKVAQEKTEVTLTAKTALQLVETRGTLSDQIRIQIKSLEEQYYISIENVVLVDIAFSDAFEQAVEQKMQAQIAADKAKAEAERLLIEAKARLDAAEFEKQIAVVQAQADAEAMNILMRLWNGEAWTLITEATYYEFGEIIDGVKYTAAHETAGLIPEGKEVGDWMIEPKLAIGGEIKTTAEYEWRPGNFTAPELEAIRTVMLKQIALEKWDGKVPETVVGNDFFEWLFGLLP